MKLNAKAFAITFTTIFTVLILVISVWSRASTQFGAEFMDAFNSVHPHPFRASLESLSTLEHVYGAALDAFYAIVDSLIFAFSFCFLYNRLAGEETGPRQTDSAGQDS
ncbi:MAG: hypothetical protein RIF32_03345 [Leptospirales bacterium]|jgi:hypothetical protein